MGAEARGENGSTPLMMRGWDVFSMCFFKHPVTLHMAGEQSSQSFFHSKNEPPGLGLPAAAKGREVRVAGEPAKIVRSPQKCAMSISLNKHRANAKEFVIAFEHLDRVNYSQPLG